MMAFKLSLFFLGLYSVQAANYGFRVEDFAQEEGFEDDDDWAADAWVSAETQDSLDAQQVRMMQGKARLLGKKGIQMNQKEVSEFAELVDEDSSVGKMQFKLTHLEKMASLQRRWKELAEQLRVARVDEFLDQMPKMPKTVAGLEAEVMRLENIKKVEGLFAEAKPEAEKKKASNLLQMSALSAASSRETITKAAREKSAAAIQSELEMLKQKVEAADTVVADNMRIVEKATTSVDEAHEALEDSKKLWADAAKELRHRDRLWAQKERAHLENEYQQIVALKEDAEKKLQLSKNEEMELTGQQMLTSVGAAMQAARMKGEDEDTFTAELKKELEKNELDIGDFTKYVKKEKNPTHLAGWGMYKQGPAGITAKHLAMALKGMDSIATADQLAQNIYEVQL